MLQSAELLKHKLLIGLIYGCGLRCMEVMSIELQHLDFDRKMLHIVQGKGQKDRYVPLSEHLIRGLKTFISIENPERYLFNGNQNRNIEEIDVLSKDFDSRYSQRGVQWVIKTISKKAGITKDGIPPCLPAIGSAAAQPPGYRFRFMPQKWNPEVRQSIKTEALQMFFVNSIYPPRTLRFIRKRPFGLCPIAALQLWVVISMRTTAAETFPSVTIPAGTDIVRSARGIKRKSGSKSANRTSCPAVITMWFLPCRRN